VSTAGKGAFARIAGAAAFVSTAGKGAFARIAGAAAFVSMAGEGAFARIAGAAAFDIILGERASFLVERDFHPLHVFISLCPFQLSTCFFFAPPPHPLQPPAYNRLSCSSFTSLSTIMVV
jgi:hypothetical protein